RPRNTPTRTAIGVAVIVSGTVIQIAGGDDVISFHLGISVQDLVWVLRAGFFVFPVLAFLLTRRICVGLQRADRRRLRAGRPFGIISQSADGAGAANGDGARGYAPVSRPMSEDERARMDAHRPDELVRPIPRHLVPLPTPRRVLEQVRARTNHFYLLSWLEAPYKNGGPPDTPGGGHRGRTEEPAGEHKTSSEGLPGRRPLIYRAAMYFGPQRRARIASVSFMWRTMSA
ncbi:MAG: hypothetical protein J2P30_01820, partial [Actinobacteria bacterium]|nr:hypothetical protein [Actinomycetota bacterium]